MAAAREWGDHGAMTSTSPNPESKPWYAARIVTVLRVTAAIVSIVAGSLIAVVAGMVGDCAAFGGSCPREPAFDFEVFRFAAAGTALAVGPPIYLFRPGRRRFILGLVVALGSAAIVGAMVASATAM